MEKSFGELLRELREKRGFSVNQLALKSGVSVAHISRLENELRSAPKTETIRKLSKILGNHEELMRAAGHLPEKEEFDLSQIPNAFPVGQTKLIPVIGVIRAGEPIYTYENISEWVDVPVSEMSSGEYFFLRVKGESMIGARILDKNIVYVRQQPDVENGEIAVVIVDDEEATLKRVYKSKGFLTLRAENPNYPEKSYYKKDNTKVSIIGKAIFFKSEVR